MRNWREWFVPPDETTEVSEYQQMEDAAEAAGSRNKTLDKLLLKVKTQPRCVSCKRFMGYSSGMYIMINEPWRLHISCFEKVIEEKFKDGEVIDLNTGTIIKLDSEAEDEER